MTLINNKFKICKGCNKPRIYFTVGYCEYCSIKNSIKNGKPPYKYKRKTTGELALFKQIWMERPHICTNCQDPIKYFNVGNFSHNKSKKQHSELRLVKTNIRILCLICHYAFDFRGKAAFEARTKEQC